MHLKNAFLLIIVIYLQIRLSFSNQYPIQIELPNPSNDEYPFYVFFNSRKLLFTSSGVYHVKQNQSDYYLQSAYPEYLNTLHSNAQSSNYFVIDIDSTTQLLSIPYLDSNIFFKTYKKSTNYNHIINFSYTIVPKTRPDIQLTNDKKIVMSFVDYNTHKGVLIVMNQNKEIEIEQSTPFTVIDGLFSCKYYPKFDHFICIFGSLSTTIYYAIFTISEGFTDKMYFCSAGSDITVEGVKLLSIFDSWNPAVFVTKYTRKVYLIHFTIISANSIELNDIKPFEITVENYLDFYFAPLSTKGVILIGTTSGIFYCWFFVNVYGFENLNIPNKNLCAGTNANQLRVSMYNNIMVLTYRKNNDNNVYLFEQQVSVCKEYSLLVTSNEPITFRREEMVDMNKYDGDEYSGIYIFKSKNNYLSSLGLFLELDDEGNLGEQVVFRNKTYFYKAIAYIAKYPQIEYYQYIIYFYVNENFYIPSVPSCFINITVDCYDSCQTCDEVGNSIEHKCTNCKGGYFPKELTSNCYTSILDNHFFDEVLQIYRPCLSHCYSCNDGTTCNQCDEGYTMLSVYSNNENDYQCVLTCHYYFYFNIDNELVCLSQNEICPPLYPCVNDETKRCYPSSEIESGVCHIELPETKEVDEIQDYISNNIVDLYKENYIEYKENYTALVYDSKHSRNKGNLTEIELKGCEDSIRKEYSIEDDSPLLIGQTEFIEDGNVLYAFYLDDGREINMSICQNQSVEISKPFDETELTLNKTTINLLAKESIDVFNTNDSFFNDDCFSFSDNFNNEERDVTIIDRRTKYYQNITIKKEDCEYSSNDLTSMRLTFKCSVKHKDNILYFTGEAVNQFSSTPSENTYNVVLCLSQIGKLGLMAKNIGNYIMLVIFILQVLLFLVYLCYLKTLFLPYLETVNDTKQDTSEDLTKKNESNVYIYEKPRIRNMNHKIEIELQNKIGDNTTTNNDHSTNYPSIIKPHQGSLDYSDFEKAVMFDKRSFCNIFCRRLKMFSTVCMICDKKLQRIKYITISTFLFYISLDMFFNALLYSNRYISHIYYNGYHFSYEIDKYIYSSIFTLGIKIFFDVVIIRNFPKYENNQENEFNQIEKEEYITKMKRCNCFLFLLVITGSFFIWYYVPVFCSIYHKTQWYWLYGALFSILINKTMTFIAALLCSCLRVSALRCNNEILFHLGKVIEIC